mmetsp:Transcript_45264/g.105013  ORF Transcript_45264/g.105013 Transcript_45264/m.105013 type:complete len:515 (-) Transcript_45264:73-1617(-)
MIHYDVGTWGVGYIFQWKGSVLPRAMVWALPNACFGALMSLAFRDGWILKSESTDWVQVWSSYAFVLGFLLVFRTSNAYTRYWEGASILQQVRGEWYNAVSSVIAFSSREKDKQNEVQLFQHRMIRLMSMLYCSALQQMSTHPAEDFSILNIEGLDKRSLAYLSSKTDKSEVILQWMQRLVVEGMNNGIVPVPAPIVTRVFQELSRGIVTVQNARKIAEFLFPFPCAQMCTIMLMIYWFVTPVLCATLLESWWWAGMLSGLSTHMLWSLYYIALEIEMPFGSDDNDLPLIFMQEEMNESLWMLLEARSQHCPTFDFDSDRDLEFQVEEPGFLIDPEEEQHRARRSSMAGKNFMHGRSVWNGDRLKTALTRDMRSKSRMLSARSRTIAKMGEDGRRHLSAARVSEMAGPRATEVAGPGALQLAAAAGEASTTSERAGPTASERAQMREASHRTMLTVSDSESMHEPPMLQPQVLSPSSQHRQDFMRLPHEVGSRDDQRVTAADGRAGSKDNCPRS